jgi:hypothetical protein
MGRGMMIVPPEQPKSNQPQIAVLPPQQTNTTTIGTIVEPQPVSVPKDEPKQSEPSPERKPLDLAQEILTHIWELGGAKSKQAQDFYDKSHDTLQNWTRVPGSIPLSAINKFLARHPGVKDIILDELKPHFEAKENQITSLPNRGKADVLICTPVLERMTPPYAAMLGVLNKRYELGFTFQGDTLINRSRNYLAKRFLESGCKWSLWIDSDIAAPVGHRDWFKSVLRCTNIPDEFLEYEVFSRLQSHGKPIVGGLYASRQWQGKLVIQPEIHPRDHNDKLLCNEIRRGTARGLVPVDWIAFGCALVHREVFLEVQRRFPILAPQQEMAPWRFFQPEGDEGEDEAFCRRAKACAIPIWLDTQLICGHIGQHCFLPEHTMSTPAL